MKMEYKKIVTLLKELELLLKKYGDNSIINSYRIVQNLIEILNSDATESEKKDFFIRGYNQLYPGKGGLSEFYVWDNDYEKRIEINAPFERIHDTLWEIVREYDA